MMGNWMVRVLCLVSCLILFNLALARSAAIPADKEHLLHELDLVDDDGSIETQVMNYLYAKKFIERLRAQMDVSDLQRKRSYWKQCAFNAVSCFGK